MKPRFSALAILTVLSLFLLVSCKHSAKTDNAVIKGFLNNFNTALKSGKTDSIIKDYFNEDNFKIRRLVNLLAGNSGAQVKAAPIFKVNMDIDASQIGQSAPGMIDVTIPVTFTSTDSIGIGHTVLTIKLNTADIKRVRIMQVSGAKFLTDYIAYENLVKSKTLTDKDIYAPITLQAFEAAKQLKSKYDSVIWFSHINKQNYFYVINGKWDIYDWDGITKSDSAKTYKMGLVGPDFKEIIPVEYDLVHNINGTFNGMIEVEKDHKRGFYSLDGKIALPVEYDQIFPVTNGDGIAALRKGDDYFWLNKDFTVSPKADLKIADILAQAVHIGSSNLSAAADDNLTEFNSREQHGSVYVPPSYLVDLNIFKPIQLFKNPTRRNVDFEEVSSEYDVKLNKKSEENDGSMFTTVFYSIRDYFLGGRESFYDKRNIVIIDKKRNQAYTHDLQVNYEPDGSEGPEDCNEYSIRNINDTLFEVKVSANVFIELPDEKKADIKEAPVYHYLYVKNKKLEELDCRRIFTFTKFVKMDNSYLRGCYSYASGQTDYLKSKYLQYMKNEIFADYNYKFKNTKWSDIFTDALEAYKPDNDKVDDSLTTIDKYNINWIEQKLKQEQNNSNRLVLK